MSLPLHEELQKKAKNFIHISFSSHSDSRLSHGIDGGEEDNEVWKNAMRKIIMKNQLQKNYQLHGDKTSEVIFVR